MPRVKRAVHAMKRRRKTLKLAKGYQNRRKSHERLAREALLKAGNHAFAGRKQKKRTYRRLWNVRINAAARANGLTYATLIDRLHKANIELDRKSLAHIAFTSPEAFTRIVEAATPTKK